MRVSDVTVILHSPLRESGVPCAGHAGIEAINLCVCVWLCVRQCASVGMRAYVLVVSGAKAPATQSLQAAQHLVGLLWCNDGPHYMKLCRMVALTLSVTCFTNSRINSSGPELG